MLLVAVAELVDQPAEFGHVGAAVVPGYTCMQVPPDSLDGVELGRVGGQEVENHLAVHVLEGLLGLLAAMDDVVVHDQVDASRLGVVRRYEAQQGDEQVACLPLAAAAEQQARRGVVGACDV